MNVERMERPLLGRRSVREKSNIMDAYEAMVWVLLSLCITSWIKRYFYKMESHLLKTGELQKGQLPWLPLRVVPI